jgi:hypothetical protein
MLKWLAAVMVLAVASHARAIEVGNLVTKGTQGTMGLEFTVSAVRESDEAVVVALRVPKKGILKDLQKVRLTVHEGKRLLLTVPLEIREESGSSVRTSFQLVPELADKATIDLYTEVSKDGPAFARFYSVRLNEYIQDKRHGK